ncbi:MAG: GIY-YIG nuclease family protein [Desulfurivibrionaceae bacterium]|jgi:putative endonuclease
MAAPPPNQPAWFVYLVRCHDDTLYCGIATDLARRLAEHNSADKGAKYTRGRRPVQLIYTEEVSSRSVAMQREGQIKKMSKTRKNTLIDSITNQLRTNQA